jgi:putative iron-dependent peroxidase
VTGTLFFVPSATFLEDVSDEAASAEASVGGAPPDTAGADETGQSAVAPKDGSLGIGSLKGDIRHE